MVYYIVIGSLILLDLAMFSSGIDSTTENQIVTGLEAGANMAEFASKLGPDSNRYFLAAGRMAGFLGAAGAMASFILAFVPKEDSPELKFMKHKFAEVNTKLDRILSEFENVKNLITLENQRAVYIKEASKIIIGFKEVNKFIDEVTAVKCSDKTTCKRLRIQIAERYVKEFDLKNSLFMIMHGSTNHTSVFGDPLLELVRKTFKCSIGKIDSFANRVLTLAFKAQQVVTIHEMLTGSKDSVVASIKSWLDYVFSLRNMVDKQKNWCYKRIKDFMLADLRNSKYQTHFRSNGKAVNSLKKELETKYNWLHWTVYSYNAWEGKNHYVTSKVGAFWSMPVPKEKRKRNIVAIPQGKGEFSYLRIKKQFSSSIERIRSSYMFGSYSAKNLLREFEKRLKEDKTWKLVKSFSVLTKYKHLVSDPSNSFYYYNEVVEVYIGHWPKEIRIIAVLYSVEELDSMRCDQTCSGHGKCVMLPFSPTKICQCNPGFQGNNCQEHFNVKLALGIENLLKATLKIPKISDVLFAIEDMQMFLSSSLDRVLSAINILGYKIQKSFQDLNRQLTHQFHWNNLLTMYSKTLKSLIYFSHVFNATSSNQTFDIRKASEHVADPNGAARWLYDLHYLIVGRSDLDLLSHKSVMAILMEKHAKIACSSTYNRAIRAAWQQLDLLQTKGFIMWMQAREDQSLSTGAIEKLRTSRIQKQNSILESLFCSMNIKTSMNIHCPAEGLFLPRQMKLPVKCPPNHYVKGSLMVNCGSNYKSTSCVNCGCNIHGSTNRECKDISGKCSCKKRYYGTKCSKRDCIWRSWSSWNACTRRCGYGGIQKRFRKVAVARRGLGKNCLGRLIQSRVCKFRHCCHKQFHCSRRRKCISIHRRCNYINNCGDNEDEHNCRVNCHNRWTRWNKEKKGKVEYLDRHHPYCLHGSAMKLFRLQRSRRKKHMRYWYVCCSLPTYLYWTQNRSTRFNKVKKGRMVYLDRHSIDCGTRGVLRSFRLNRNRRHNRIRYNYSCAIIKRQYRARTRCYTYYTGFTKEKKGKVYYLARQHAACKNEYYLSFARLRRNRRHNRIRYLIRCCRILHF